MFLWTKKQPIRSHNALSRLSPQLPYHILLLLFPPSAPLRLSLRFSRSGLASCFSSGTHPNLIVHVPPYLLLRQSHCYGSFDLIQNPYKFFGELMAMATALSSPRLAVLSVKQRLWGISAQRLMPLGSAFSNLSLHSLPAKSAMPGKLLITKELVGLSARSVLFTSVLIPSNLAASEAAVAVAPNAPALQAIAELATDINDSRGLIVLAVILPALGWVLYNILQPALNQLNRMKASKGMVGALGLSAAGAAGCYMGMVPGAEAVQGMATAADSDSRGLIILFVLLPALGWVAFNILQPALNQLNRMKQ